MTHNDITLETLYSILKDCVRRYPETPGRQCKQPQTFRVLQLDHGAELLTNAMGAKFADKDTPYFYSRSWERQKHTPNNITAEYPVLTAFEIASDLPNGLKAVGVFQSYSVEIAVLDVYADNCDVRPTSCDNRTINQIYADTETILLTVLDYLTYSVIATVGDVTGVYNTKLLDMWVQSGEIDSYDIVHDIGQTIRTANSSLRTVHVEMAANKRYGTKVRLNFPAYRCFTTEFQNVSCVDYVNQFQGC